MNRKRLHDLIMAYLTDSITATEGAELTRLLQSPESQEIFQELIYSQLQGEMLNLDQPSFQSLERIKQFLAEKMDETQPAPANDLPPDTFVQSSARHIRFLNKSWFRYAAAAIILAFGIGVYLWTTNRKSDQTLAEEGKPLPADIAPGGNHAFLTLADGSTIALDSASNGHLASQGDVQIVKLASGQIEYNLQGLTANDVLWNTMSTPVGGQYQVTLPDGTKAWLNAASSITFPTAFTGEKRQVKIYGEVYFEVARNNQKPFMVDVDGKSVVEVLGTSFNINSYHDEGSIRTALLEGSVKIMYGKEESVLKPGYQATIAFSGQPPGSKDSAIQIQPAHLDQALAWKNGLFSFNDADLRSVMRELERWYDINVQYRGAVPAITLKGKMYRNVNLSAVLDFLQRMGVDVRMEGKTLVVI